MKNYIKKEYFHNFPKNKVKLVHLFGRQYWKQQTEEEFEDNYENVICENISGIHDEKQLGEFIVQKMGTMINMFEGNPVRWLLIPDYKENESIVIYYGNHGFIDGI